MTADGTAQAVRMRAIPHRQLLQRPAEFIRRRVGLRGTFGKYWNGGDRKSERRLGEVRVELEGTAETGSGRRSAALQHERVAESAMCSRFVRFERQGPLQRGGGFFQSALFRQDDAQISQRFRMSRVMRKCPRIAGDRALGVALGAQHIAGIVVRFCKAGAQLQCPSVRGHRLHELALRLQSVAHVVVRIRMIRLVSQNFAVALDRLVQTALRLPQQAAVVVRLEISRVEVQGVLVCGVRLIEPTLRLEGITEIVVKGGDPGIFGNRTADVQHGLVEPARLVREHSAQVQRVDVARIGLQNLCVEAFRLGKASALVAVQGGVQQLANVRRLAGLHASPPRRAR